MKQFGIALLVVGFSGWVGAYEEVSYDTLVSELSRSNSRAPLSSDPLENVRFHLGVGMSNTVSTLTHGDGRSTYISQRGVQAALGIDLFSRNWLAEMSVATFGEKEYERSQISLREFGLNLVFIDTLDTSSVYYRFQAGLGARYLKARYRTNTLVTAGGTSAIQEAWIEDTYSTPSSIVGAGLGAHLSKSISVGAGILARNSLTNETPDQSSFDFLLRLDGQF